jgi:acetyltransferase-like isoleucine patch superfamily enzyme
VADIGEGTFIGAHSLVTRPIPAHCLAFGTPAKPAEYFRTPAAPAERVLLAEG